MGHQLGLPGNPEPRVLDVCSDLMAEGKLSHGRNFGLHSRPQTEKVLRILAYEKNAQILFHSKLLLGPASLLQYNGEGLETFSVLTSLTS